MSVPRSLEELVLRLGQVQGSLSTPRMRRRLVEALARDARLNAYLGLLRDSLTAVITEAERCTTNPANEDHT